MSTRHNRFVGLILPGVWLLYTVAGLIMNVAANKINTGYMVTLEDGTSVEIGGGRIPAVENFLIASIGTVLLLVIYFICRRIISTDKNKRLTAELKRPPDGGSSYYG